MKTLLCALAALLCIPHLGAATIRVSGALSWKVTKPDCTFKLDGTIQNLSPSGTTSGTLKLILWATPTQFPSRGYPIAEHTLGQLSGGYQFNHFTKKVPVSVPAISGNYYFTIAIVEYTTAGWRTSAYVTTGRKRLENGDFVTGAAWAVPTPPVIAPPSKLRVDDELALTVKANGKLNLISAGTYAKTKITVNRKSMATVAVAGHHSSVPYTYTLKNDTLNGVKVPVGRLSLDPGNVRGSSTITLFFQSPTSGVYRNVRASRDGDGTTWGLFSYN